MLRTGSVTAVTMQCGKPELYFRFAQNGHCRFDKGGPPPENRRFSSTIGRPFCDCSPTYKSRFDTVAWAR
jgi:hypothetical protein